MSEQNVKICPLMTKDINKPVECQKEKCGFYSQCDKKCAVVSIENITYHSD